MSRSPAAPTPAPGAGQTTASTAPATSTASYRTLVESISDYAIFSLDPKGYVTSWNTGAARIKGYSREEIVGQHFSRFYTDEANARNWPEIELEAAGRLGRFEDEGWRVRKDGSLFWANVVITALRDPHGTLIGFGKVTRDMTERKRLEELEQSERRMNAFLATLSHELRNPLAPMRNALTVLQLHPDDPDTVHKSVSLIERQMSHLTRLVDDLLDVGRIAAGKIELRREPLDAAEIIALGIEAAEPALAAKSQTVAVTTDATPIPLVADRTRLIQVMQNLLLNASKFSSPGASITVSASVRHRTAAIQVIDHGRGIAPGALESIFNLFVQEDGPGSGAQGGLGIGLSLCRALVEMHGGSISAASDGPGRGAIFTVQLPLATAPQAHRPSADIAMGSTHSHHVLLVDDNRDAADSLAMLLEISGHTVTATYDGMEAVRLAARVHPDVVLIDLAMPGMDGFAVIHALRRMPALANTRYVALTGFGQASDREQTAAAGFDRHLVKPIEADVLLKIIDGE